MITILTIISLILVALAAASNSVMDTVDHHQSKSIFSKLKDQKWWNAKNGWKNKYVDYDYDASLNLPLRRVKWHIFGITFNKPVQLTDSWHFFKMLMIVFMCLSTIIFPYTVYCYCDGYNIWEIILAVIIWLLVLGITWNLTFSWTYNKLFILKNQK